MGYTVKLSRGTSSIDLTTGRYSADFTPPRGMGVYVFDVRVLGASMAEMQAAKKDLEKFIQHPDDNANPLYLEWKPDTNIAAEPVWGQFGATKKAEVIEAYVDWWDNYNLTQQSAKGAKLIVTCTLGAIEGSRQLLANAKGGIVEDWIGTVDGISRGLMIPEGDTTNGNKSLNPIFGHATWNTGWTAGSGITAAKNTDPQFVLWGLNSAKLSASSATAADNVYYETINAGNTNKHTHTIYAILPDRSAISATHIQLFYNDAVQTTTYTAMGDGWYRLGCANFDGVSAATCDAGVAVKRNYTVYITGHQLEERAYATPFFYGDMLGDAWTGTPHESKSTRAASTLQLPTVNNILSNSVFRLIWRAGNASTDITSKYLYHDGTNIHADYSTATGKWTFAFLSSTGIALANTYDDTFAINDHRVFHVDLANTKVYVNGVSVGGTNNWAYQPMGANLYLGTDNSSANNINGTFVGLTGLYGNVTAAEVLADYTNIAQLIADGQPVDPIPYLWSASADGVVQNGDDGTNQNWAVVGGLQGDLPADVETKLVTTSNDVYISNLDFDYRKFIDPEFLSYFSATVDEISINTADTTLATVSMDNDEFEMVKGRYVSMMIRADEDAAGNNLVWRTGINPGGAYYYTPYEASVWIASASNDLSIDLSPNIALPGDEFMFNLLGINRAVSVRATAYRTVAGALTFRLQSAQVMPLPITRLNLISGNSASGILYVVDHAYEIDVSNNLAYNYHIASSDLLRFIPGRYNLLISYMGGEAAVSTAGAEMTYSSVYYKPRWSSM
jgi:hypothetical protein